jgi:membrane-associated PAP2 superfamily phosphatase
VGDVAYTFEPTSFGGFIGNFVNDAVVNPGGDFLNKLSDFMKNLLSGPIKWLLIIMAVLLVGYVIFKFVMSRKASGGGGRGETIVVPEYGAPPAPASKAK